MQTIYLGVDVGGTKTAVVLSAQPPVVLGRIEFLTQPERGPQHALATIVESARRLLLQHGLQQEQLASIGVSCGSPLDRVQGIIHAPPNLSTWVDVPIRRLLEEGVRDGSIRAQDLKMTSFALAGALNWIAHWYRENQSMTPGEIAEAFIRIFNLGLAPRAAEDQPPTRRPRVRKEPIP